MRRRDDGTFGTVDILVNNAQEVTLGPLLDMTRDNFEDGWLSGPVASFSFMKACHEHLKDGGVVINLATSASLRLDPMGYGVYGAVKDATRILSRVAATEWGADGIRVICLMPLAASPGVPGLGAVRSLKAPRSSAPASRCATSATASRTSAVRSRCSAVPTRATSPAAPSPSTEARPTCVRPQSSRVPKMSRACAVSPYSFTTAIRPSRNSNIMW